MTALPGELLTDRYQFTMADSYLSEGTADGRVAFELFVRELPPRRGFLIAAGLARVVDLLIGLRFGEESLRYLRSSGTASGALCERLATLRFDGDLHAVPEGTAVTADEPLLRVEGSRLLCQLVESVLLNQTNFQTLIATKAARLVTAAAGRPVVDFGLRRAHGADAGVLAARAAYLGGCAGTATVAAGMLWGIPTVGTMAHSFVMGHETELAAFERLLRDQPADAVLLIDTYDTVNGARVAVEAARTTGIHPRGVRLDSGDLAALSREVRSVLDAGGLTETTILASGDLDEYLISGLVTSGAPIDSFGVGTALVTSSDAPALGGVYKLVESDGRPVMKMSSGKATLPGRHQVFRNGGPDVIAMSDEDLPGRALLEPVLIAGALARPQPTLAESRAYAAQELAALPSRTRDLMNPSPLETRLSPQASALKELLT
jgi:nicotinate phosphoribosyltransferase